MNSSKATDRQLGERGTGAIEFALIAGAIVGLAACGADIVNYARTRLKLDEVSNGLASLVSGYQQLYTSDFSTFYQVSQQTAGNIDVTGLNVTPSTGATILTGITNPSGTPTVAWRQQTGNPSFVSALVGAVGTAVTNMPDSYVVPQGSSVIVVEVFGSVSPWVLSKKWMGTSGPSTLGSITLFQPRAALLSQINAGNRPS